MGYLEVISVESPPDRFANHFLQFLERKFGVTEGLKVKVYYANADLWDQLYQADRMATRGNPNEYKTNPVRTAEDWKRVNGTRFQIWNQTTGQNATEEDRLATFLRMGFPPELAQEMSRYDATIFMNPTNLDRLFPALVKQRVPFPDLSVVAHEVVHVVEKSTGKQIITQWDNQRTFENPEVTNLFKQFVDDEKITPQRFRELYLKKPEAPR